MSSTRRPAVLAAIATATLVVAVPSSATAAPAKKRAQTCETFDRFLQQLTVDGVTCPGARRVIYSWARSSACIPAGEGFIQDRARTCTVRGFVCKPRKGEGGVRVTCKSKADAERVIRFFDSQG
ncbi:hypothetical protein DSM112329_03146 [Paraconexibacter sp. AEG42_29]|uniref:Secreted protein n=1 Tax=Paraconexibacter sp. AEG42_29 TaxID=2997339 RepID=A0AAU7AX25_9ACTN